MQREIISPQGLCRASIRTEEEIEEIQARLDEVAPWTHRTLRWLEAIKDPTRFKLVYLLFRYERLCVCDLANILGVSSSAISQHLRKLKDLDLVSASRQQQTLFYAIQDAEFKAFFSGLTRDDAFSQEAVAERVGMARAGG